MNGDQHIKKDRWVLEHPTANNNEHRFKGDRMSVPK